LYRGNNSPLLQNLFWPYLISRSVLSFSNIFLGSDEYWGRFQNFWTSWLWTDVLLISKTLCEWKLTQTNVSYLKNSGVWAFHMVGHVLVQYICMCPIEHLRGKIKWPDYAPIRPIYWYLEERLKISRNMCLEIMNKKKKRKRNNFKPNRDVGFILLS
jgi:hypothetical protein